MSPVPRCRFCFTRERQGRSDCAVCGIRLGKDKKELTPEEKGLADRCRTLYTLGFLSIVVGGFGIFLTLPAIILGLRGNTKNLGIAPDLLPYYVLSMLTIHLFSIFFGLALRRYRKECRPAGFFLYAAMLVWSVLASSWLLVVMAAVYLGYLATPPTPRVLRAR